MEKWHIRIYYSFSYAFWRQYQLPLIFMPFSENLRILWVSYFFLKKIASFWFNDKLILNVSKKIVSHKKRDWWYGMRVYVTTKVIGLEIKFFYEFCI